MVTLIKRLFCRHKEVKAYGTSDSGELWTRYDYFCKGCGKIVASGPSMVGRFLENEGTKVDYNN